MGRSAHSTNTEPGWAGYWMRWPLIARAPGRHQARVEWAPGPACHTTGGAAARDGVGRSGHSTNTEPGWAGYWMRWPLIARAPGRHQARVEWAPGPACHTTGGAAARDAWDGAPTRPTRSPGGPATGCGGR
ncbi:hypothetical protein GCM10027053_26690 [Intrasporangium mesophilum]